MSNYVAIKSEANLWTVGSYDEDGRFDAIEDFSSAIDAQDLRDILNSPVRVMQMIKKIEQQQSVNDLLMWRTEELEEKSFKNEMRDLLLQAMASASEMPMYPVDLEMEDGSFIKAVIAIKIQEVGVAK